MSANSREDAEELLRAGPWVALSDEALRAMAAAMRVVHHARGSVIIRQGDPGGHLHVLVSGTAGVRVRTDGGASTTVARLGKGDCFGEMSLLTGDPASADVVAADDAETLALDRTSYNALLAENPGLLHEFVRMISRRLRATDVAIGVAYEREQELSRFLREGRSGRYGEVLGRHPAIKALAAVIDEQAKSDRPVLIQGERGTGKELAARSIHARSARKDAAFVCVDCAHVAVTQWGDALFGDHNRRGPVRPDTPRVCYMDLAEGGTILLKNVDALPLAVEERLIRFLRSRELPGDPSRYGDARVIATCRADLTDSAIGGQVSPALAMALSGQTIVLPPLRDRKKDIPQLARHFATKHAERLSKQAVTVSDQAMIRLVSHNYRLANVAELEEAVERAVILTDNGVVDANEVILGAPPDLPPGGYNLLRLPAPVVKLATFVFPRSIRCLAAVVFMLILCECMLGPASGDRNAGPLLVWSVWWPVLALSFLLPGRAWCAVCPMPLPGMALQRLVKPRRKPSAWLQEHATDVVMAGFVAIVWVEEATAMRHSPRATGVFLLCILAGAVVTAVLLQRRAWCRYLCPLGGFAGLCSTSAVLELRPSTDICSAKCKDHLCYKGDERTAGCPMFNHVMFINTNQHCVLCMDCVRACPNMSPQLNIRLPGRELWTTPSAGPEVGRFVAVILGLLAAVSLIQHWEAYPFGWAPMLLTHHRLAVVSFLLLSSVVFPLLLLWVRAPRGRAKEDPEAVAGFWQRVACWAPMATAGFASYQLGFAPKLRELGVTLYSRSLSGVVDEVGALALLPAMRFGILFAGMLVTIVVSHRLAVASKGTGEKHWVRRRLLDAVEVLAYWVIVQVLMLRPEWLTR